jgi:desulfoferrodoxin (superoxide reductase-like protein)
MGKQSARLYYDGKDHKDIFFQGNYHRAMYKGNRLVWEKITEGNHIPYISREGNDMVLKVLYVDGRTTVTVGNSKKFVSYYDRIVRGKNIVGFVVTNGQIVYSTDGETFKAIEGTSKEDGNAGRAHELYSSQINNFCWYWKRTTKSYPNGLYYLVDTDVESSATKELERWLFSSYNTIEIVSGIIKPKLNILLYIRHSHTSGQSPSYTRNVRIYDRGTNEYRKTYAWESGAPYPDIPTIALGSDGQFLYVYGTQYNDTLRKEANGVSKYGIKKDSISYTDVTGSKIPYEYIKTSLYKNGKFIVYCSVEGKLEIYTTNDFIDFTKISVNHSIRIRNIASGKDITVSFDKNTSGDIYIQPYCNLDNTYCFDDNGIMHEDNGCLFCSIDENAEPGTTPRRAMFYFDNFYFEESEGNFCEISD